MKKWEHLRAHSYAGSTNPASSCTDGSNKRLEFSTTTNQQSCIDGGTCGNDIAGGNRAYHPVAAVGRNQSTALSNQLLGGLDTTNTIQCTDCHNNNDTGAGTFSGVTGTPTYAGPVTQSNLTPARGTDLASNYTGSEPVGPHGSTNIRLLRANYNTFLGTQNNEPFGSFDAANFALCFNCHDVAAFATDGGPTNFRDDSANTGCGACEVKGKGNLHMFHLEDKVHTTCANCHYNVHSNAEATNTIFGNGTGGELPADGDTHLINFSPQVEALAPLDKPRWRYDSASGNMECRLTCHDFDMDSFEYEHNAS